MNYEVKPGITSGPNSGTEFETAEQNLKQQNRI